MWYKKKKKKKKRRRKKRRLNEIGNHVLEKRTDKANQIRNKFSLFAIAIQCNDAVLCRVVV